MRMDRVLKGHIPIESAMGDENGHRNVFQPRGYMVQVMDKPAAGIETGQ
jgi:hypothetical protein